MSNQDLATRSPVDDDIYALADDPPAEAPARANGNRLPVPPIAPTPPESSPAPLTAGPDQASAAPRVPAPRASLLKGIMGSLASIRPSKAVSQQAKAQPAGAPAASRASPTTRRPKGEINLRGKQGPKRSWTEEAPAWALSAVVHGTIFGVLAMAGLTPQVQDLVKSIDSAPFDPKLSGDQAEEMLHILNPVADAARDQAVGELSMTMETGGGGGPSGLGTGPARVSSTPSLAGRGHGSSGGLGDNSLPNVQVGGKLSPVATMLPSLPGRDLGGGGMIAGDVTAATTDIGEALDQLAREILRHLADHKLTVIWLFDESGSMKDDQQAIREKFDRVANELKLNVDEEKKAENALTHVIVGFGSDYHLELPRPTTEIDTIGRAIERLRVDETGIENTLQAIQHSIAEYSRLINNERKLLIVLVTDESGDDGAQIEEARQMAKSQGVPIYIIGRQSLFGYDRAHLRYIDPVTKDEYWPAIRRGPETAGLECLQWDGLHERWDEQPSGFAPYELARMVKDTGGIYFLLPSEENMRVRQREKAYSMNTLREYVPDYKSRMEYIKLRNASELRRSLYEIIEGTKSFGFRRHFPVEIQPLAEAISNEFPIVEQRLVALIQVEQRLRNLKKDRDREPDKRWQAHYDLMLAQIVCSQIKAYEYRACLKEMIALANQSKLAPNTQPVKDKVQVDWLLEHSRDRKAPPAETEKKYAEAEKLLREVIARHPKTPWADLAQDCLDRGFGVQRVEWAYNPQYNERAKLVPKY